MKLQNQENPKWESSCLWLAGLQAVGHEWSYAVVASKQHLIPLASHPSAGFGISSKPHLCSSTLADPISLPFHTGTHKTQRSIQRALPSTSFRPLSGARSLLPKRSSSKPRSSKWPCGCLWWQNGQGTQLLEISCSSLHGCSNLEGSNCTPLCFLTCPSYRVQQDQVLLPCSRQFQHMGKIGLI